MTLSELLSLLRITRCSDISLCPPQSTQIHFKGSWFSRRCLIFKVPSALAAVIESISYHIPLVKYLVVVSSRFLPRSLWGAALSISYSKPFVNTFFLCLLAVSPPPVFPRRDIYYILSRFVCQYTISCHIFIFHLLFRRTFSLSYQTELCKRQIVYPLVRCAP